MEKELKSKLTKLIRQLDLGVDHEISKKTQGDKITINLELGDITLSLTKTKKEMDLTSLDGHQSCIIRFGYFKKTLGIDYFYKMRKLRKTPIYGELSDDMRICVKEAENILNTLKYFKTKKYSVFGNFPENEISRWVYIKLLEDKVDTQTLKTYIYNLEKSTVWKKLLGINVWDKSSIEILEEGLKNHLSH